MIQGSNLPIGLSELCFDPLTLKAAHAVLYKNNTEKKAWTLNEMVTKEDLIILPITQEESLGFRGIHTIELKVTTEDGLVLPSLKNIVNFDDRQDETILEGEEAQTIYYKNIKMPKLNINAIECCFKINSIYLNSKLSIDL